MRGITQLLRLTPKARGSEPHHVERKPQTAHNRQLSASPELFIRRVFIRKQDPFGIESGDPALLCAGRRRPCIIHSSDGGEAEGSLLYDSRTRSPRDTERDRSTLRESNFAETTRRSFFSPLLSVQPESCAARRVVDPVTYTHPCFMGRQTPSGRRQTRSRVAKRTASKFEKVEMNKKIPVLF